MNRNKIIDFLVSVALFAAATAFSVLGVRQESVLCILTAGVSFLILLIRIVNMLRSEPKQDDGEGVGDGSAGMVRFLNKQSIWIRDWCRYSHEKDKRTAYAWTVGTTVVLIAIGILAKYPPMRILTLHAPLGLLMGEIFIGLCWPLISAKNNWRKIIKCLRKHIRRDLPDKAAQDAFFADYFDSDNTWIFKEECRDSVKYFSIGAQYFSALPQTGVINIVERAQVTRVETYEEIITVTVNHVRTRTHHFVVEFRNQNEVPKKQFITRFSFQTQAAQNAFAEQLRARTGDSIVIEDVGVKHA